jgi:dihydroflavonol-4-reductase
VAAYLVTGAAGFLGHHVVKLLNARGERPRVLLSAKTDPVDPALRLLHALDVERVTGDLADVASLEAACAGVDIVCHLEFEIALGDGEEVLAALHRGNVQGTRNLVQAAAKAGVRRMVVSSSSLTVGLNEVPQPLDEDADWGRYAFHLPYALSRREAEQEVLARPPGDLPEILVVNPSFTLGPDDPVGAPANGLVKRMAKPGFRLTAPIGFGVLDVRDYAEGVLLAAERGRAGQRYILSGANLDVEQLTQAVAAVAGVMPGGWKIPLARWYLRPAVWLLNLWNRLRGKPAAVSPALFELWHRYAWYDTGRARTELGWQPRELRDSLRDTLAWMGRDAMV